MPARQADVSRPNPDASTPGDRDLAFRVLRAAGVLPDDLSDEAKKQFRTVQDRARDLDPDAPNPETDPKEAWIVNSGKQLHRFFGMRCVSCHNWTPGKDGAGTCSEVSAAVGFKTPGTTDAVFGCMRYAEIPVDDAPTLRTRTELAIALGLLQAYPGNN